MHHFILVDRFSQDSTTEVVKKNFRSVRILQNDVNLAKARALGIEQVDTPYFVFMDDDMELPEGWFKRVTSYISEEIGAIHEETFWAGRECMDDSFLNRLVSNKWASSALRFERHKMVKMDITSENMMQSVGFTWGGHTVMKTEVIRDWKPSSRISAAEDLLLMKHVVGKGYVWRILEQHTVKHYSPRSLPEHLKKMRWHIAGLRATGFTQPLSGMLSDYCRQILRASVDTMKSGEPMVLGYAVLNALVNIDGYLRWNKFYTMQR